MVNVGPDQCLAKRLPAGVVLHPYRQDGKKQRTAGSLSDPSSRMQTSRRAHADWLFWASATKRRLVLKIDFVLERLPP